MANTNHEDLTGVALHEPKGAAAASANTVYLANGAGSGSWAGVPVAAFDTGAATNGQIAVSDGASGLVFRSTPHGSFSFVNVSTPYTLSFPGAGTYAKLAPTATPGGSPTEVTEDTSSKLIYTGTQTRHFVIDADICADQASGAARDLRFAIYKNGTIITATERVRTASSGSKGSVSIQGDVGLATNDYIELYARNDGASGDINIYSMYIRIFGTQEP